MSSFFCERTAEYALVPLLQRSLEAHFGSAIPIFYWKTREGNRVSSEIHQGRHVQVLAMFARRPKVTETRDIISGKINLELSQFSRAARAVGIPTIAGFPAVDSVFRLYQDPLIFWLPVEQSEVGDLEFMVDTSLRHPSPKVGGDLALRTLSLEEVIDEVKANAKAFPWNEAMGNISQLRIEGSRYGNRHMFGRFGSYRPIYFLMSNDGKHRSAGATDVTSHANAGD